MAKARKSIEKELLTSMAQAVAFAKGARKGYRVHEFTERAMSVEPHGS